MNSPSPILTLAVLDKIGASACVSRSVVEVAKDSSRELANHDE